MPSDRRFTFDEREQDALLAQLRAFLDRFDVEVLGDKRAASLLDDTLAGSPVVRATVKAALPAAAAIDARAGNAAVDELVDETAVRLGGDRARARFGVWVWAVALGHADVAQRVASGDEASDPAPPPEPTPLPKPAADTTPTTPVDTPPSDSASEGSAVEGVRRKRRRGRAALIAAGVVIVVLGASLGGADAYAHKGYTVSESVGAVDIVRGRHFLWFRPTFYQGKFPRLSVLDAAWAGGHFGLRMSSASRAVDYVNGVALNLRERESDAKRGNVCPSRGYNPTLDDITALPRSGCLDPADTYVLKFDLNDNGDDREIGVTLDPKSPLANFVYYAAQYNVLNKKTTLTNAFNGQSKFVSGINFDIDVSLEAPPTGAITSISANAVVIIGGPGDPVVQMLLQDGNASPSHPNVPIGTITSGLDEARHIASLGTSAGSKPSGVTLSAVTLDQSTG